MKSIFISYRVYEFDGRLRELRDVMLRLGDVKSVSLALNQNVYDKDGVAILTDKTKGPLNAMQYAKFLLISLWYFGKCKDLDTLVIQDTPACFPGLIMKLLRPQLLLIQDVPELKVREEKHSIHGKVFSFFEEKMIKRADILICANKYRAEVMVERFHLKRNPISYENIRILGEEFIVSDESKRLLDEIDHTKINLINLGGFSTERGTKKLVEAMINLNDKFCLYIIGGGSKQEEMELQSCINKNNITNVQLIGRMKANELKAIVHECDIGIINYHKNDLNNYYCASGKAYEYLFEGLPIVTTENLPLKELCEKFNIGEADDGFHTAILKVANNIEQYKNNVRTYMKDISVNKNNDNLMKTLQRDLETVRDERGNV